MIDPPKATKGRSMSKKTRKKSPNTPAGKATRAPSKSSAKTRAAKTRNTTVKKSAKTANKRLGNTAVRASHKAPSKNLKSPPAGESTVLAAAESAKPRAKTPAAAKTSGGKTDAAAARKFELAEGTKAPAFRLPRDGGETVALADYAGKKLVLFFYPRADTPGCTKEAIDFTRLASAFAENQTSVLGVSGDPPKAQEAFRNKHQLSIPLVSDEKHEMLRAYGAW